MKLWQKILQRTLQYNQWLLSKVGVSERGYKKGYSLSYLCTSIVLMFYNRHTIFTNSKIILKKEKNLKQMINVSHNRLSYLVYSVRLHIFKSDFKEVLEQPGPSLQENSCVVSESCAKAIVCSTLHGGFAPKWNED